VGQEGAVLYIVMEYLEGVSLDRLVRPQNLLSASESLMIIIRLHDKTVKVLDSELQQSVR
jgi:hypothetical protein